MKRVHIAQIPMRDYRITNSRTHARTRTHTRIRTRTHATHTRTHSHPHTHTHTCNTHAHTLSPAPAPARTHMQHTLAHHILGIVTGYTTSIVGNKTLEWIKSVVESGATHKPFFAYMGPHAPHLPSTPAPWYADHPVGNTPVPKQIYYNYSGVGKHAFGALPSLAAQNVAIDEAAIAQEHSNRLKTLLSVDDIVGVIHSYLVSVNEWDNTYWLQTSDHGTL